MSSSVFAENEEHHFEMRRKASFSKLTHKMSRFFPLGVDQEKDEESQRERLFKLMQAHKPTDMKSIQAAIVNHAEYSLARHYYNIDAESCYRAVSLSVRDRLIENLNDTNAYFHQKDVRRVYYLSMEFLIGRTMQNALVNLDLESMYTQALTDLGYNLESLYEYEKDAALGNGGLGRLAACFLDSCATLNYPLWGYGIRYTYGIFEQKIIDGRQMEFPDFWLVNDNPWEIPRSDCTYGVRFGGKVVEYKDPKWQLRHKWVGGEIVQAQAYDYPIPGFDTYNCINLRLWRAVPSREFDFNKFNTGNFLDAVAERQHAEAISAVLYPNDNTPQGKELRLRQQYFFCCATIQDILRRFRKVKSRSWLDLPQMVAMQLNDTHPAIAIPELMRVLLDLEKLEWDIAWDLTKQVFNYTNHTVLPEALEKWPAGLIESLLPRHLLIINDINFHFLNEVRETLGENYEVINRVSIYEEGYAKMIRMANLAVIGSNKVNGVAELHTNLVKNELFPEFLEFYKRKGFPDKIVNMTNGVTPRRWIHCANRPLSNLFSNILGSDQWLKDLDLTKGLEHHSEDSSFIDQWKEIKLMNKVRLSKWVLYHTGIKLDPNTMLFDIQTKRIHEYKRQLLNCLYIIHRYLALKDMTPKEREEAVPRAHMIGGKAAPGYINAKTIIKLTNSIANVVNNDADVANVMKVVFLPNYNVSSAQIIIPACDLSEQISTAGTEASGTGNMKFVMNGGLIIGTLDGANVEIREEGGEDTMFVFGCRQHEVAKVRQQARNGDYPIDARLRRVFDFVRHGGISDTDEVFRSEICGLLDAIRNNRDGVNGDFYLVCYDFSDYLRAQEEAERTYKDSKKWWKLSIKGASRMGKFSTDRTINEYAKTIWKLPSVERPQPTRARGAGSTRNHSTDVSISDRI